MVDYVAGHELDLSCYTTQFIRLKQLLGERMKRQWGNGVDLASWQIDSDHETNTTEPKISEEV